MKDLKQYYESVEEETDEVEQEDYAWLTLTSSYQRKKWIEWTEEHAPYGEDDIADTVGGEIVRAWNAICQRMYWDGDTIKDDTVYLANEYLSNIVPNNGDDPYTDLRKIDKKTDTENIMKDNAVAVFKYLKDRKKLFRKKNEVDSLNKNTDLPISDERQDEIDDELWDEILGISWNKKKLNIR